MGVSKNCPLLKLGHLSTTILNDQLFRRSLLTKKPASEGFVVKHLTFYMLIEEPYCADCCSDSSVDSRLCRHSTHGIS